MFGFNLEILEKIPYIKFTYYLLSVFYSSLVALKNIFKHFYIHANIAFLFFSILISQLIFFQLQEILTL